MATTTEQLSQLSHHVDAMEEITDQGFLDLAAGPPLALDNLRARLARLQQTIEMATSK